MSAAPKLRLSAEEYLRRERASSYRSEFYRGEMFAMSGASREHNLITLNLSRLVGNSLVNRRCEAYATDMRVKVSATGLYTYPDFAVVCGEPQFEDGHVDTLLNPTVLIEVLSESTEAYDRGGKADQYRQLPSLQEYVLVSQTGAHCESYRRQPGGGWLLTDARGPDSMLVLESIDVRLPLAEIYHKVQFPSAAPE